MASTVSEDELTFLVPGYDGPLVLGHPQVDYVPLADFDVANKKYVDDQALTAYIPLHITGTDLTIDAASGAAGGYITTGAQTIAGVKTFSSLPVIPQTPLANTDAASKKYVDDQTLSATSPIHIAAYNITVDDAGAAASGVVTTGAQTFAGVKTFSSLPIIPNPPLAATDAACKGYVDGLYVTNTPITVTFLASIAPDTSLLGVDQAYTFRLDRLYGHIVVMTPLNATNMTFTKAQNGLLRSDASIPATYRPANPVVIGTTKVYNVDAGTVGSMVLAADGHIDVISTGNATNDGSWDGTATGTVTVFNPTAVWYV